MPTNLKLLKAFIERSGYKTAYIAQFMGISKGSYFNKINGHTDFTILEVNKLKALLNLTERDLINIFFSYNVNTTQIIDIL